VNPNRIYTVEIGAKLYPAGGASDDWNKVFLSLFKRYQTFKQSTQYPSVGALDDWNKVFLSIFKRYYYY
jgi:hypothetical protein